MSSQTRMFSRTISTRLLLAAGLLACLVWPALMFFSVPVRDAGGRVPAKAVGSEPSGVEPSAVAAKLEGAAAHRYLEGTAEGQSLMKALTTARFGLERREESPFEGDAGAGYLGMSHDENLNAWFDEGGVTVRPTLPEEKQADSWRMGMRLKSYGYGAALHEARAYSAQAVRENRIEYERGGGGDAGGRVVEWYVNRSEGIEQGFTLDARPARAEGTGAGEPLRLVVAVSGDLRARAADDGRSAELRRGGEGVLSYSKLVAVDARGEKLKARMETDEAGDEIALVVDDAAAQYPIVVDPITATQKQELGAESFRQQDARFGFAVAIEGDIALIGAWREDFDSFIDTGYVYIFIRSGETWSLERKSGGGANGSECGWSVAISANRIVYGCPGADGGQGRAYIIRRDGTAIYSSVVSLNPGFLTASARFGTSVAVSGSAVLVGAPFDDVAGTDVGAARYFTVDSNLSIVSEVPLFGFGANHQYGASVAVRDVFTGFILVGSPGADSERGMVTFQTVGGTFSHHTPADAVAGDRFGQSVALDVTTAVIGASTDDNEKGADAGAAYVYVQGHNGAWAEQQKLTAGDGKPGDFFSANAVAIEGHTIVVGAYGNGEGGDPLNGIDDDNRGAAYVFTRSGTAWTQQAKISQNNFQGGEAGDHFGIAVDISGRNVLIGARGASAGNTVRAGAAFIYELDCLPPQWQIFSSPGLTCPGGSASFEVESKGTNLSYQWRKNGVNIPGATSRTYTVNNVSIADAGSYDVVISNACGSDISSAETLNVATFSLNPTSQNFSASGSNGIVNVTSSGSACNWTATSNAPWLTITSGASGTGNGTVGFTVAANTGAGQRTGTLTVAGQTFNVTQDGTTPPSNTFQFSQSTYSTNEGAGSTTVTVTRSGSLAAPATVEYATTDGTANDRGDYNTTIGRLRFAAGEGAKTFGVLITDDAYAEGAQSFNVTLSNPTGGASLGSPLSAAVTISDNDATTSAANPLDATAFFVRQQYVDFLSREPDASGLAFWTGGIDSCGANAGCREVKRIDTSAAFFLSIEFQETGFLVHRLYRASFGRLSRYREFVRDTQEIGRGVVVNSPGWEAQLEANKTAFFSEFAARADFQALYGPLTNAQFVDALNANTGGSLSQAERDSLVAGLNGGTETRATALRKVADDPDLRARETSRAFVLMQYFGYLRRNPDDAPDNNFSGYDFWLVKLNQFGGDYRRAEMVKAFISSAEYRHRFGQ